MNRRLKITLATALIAAGLSIAGQIVAQNARALEAQLKAAQNKADIQGDLKGAIADLKKIAETKDVDRAIAAKALLAMADYQMSLRNDEARKTYDRIIKEYPEQPAASEARERMGRLPAATASGALTTSVVCPNCISDAPNRPATSSVSSDGRFLAVADIFGLAVRNLDTGQIVRPIAFDKLALAPALVPIIESDPVGIYRQTNPNPADLLPGWGQVADPVFSQDSRWIAYAWNDRSLRVISNAAGATPRTLVDNAAQGSIRPAAWSPDGQSLLVTFEKPDGTSALGWVSVSNGALTQLRSLGRRFALGPPVGRPRGGRSGPPSLSPDGSRIAYSALAEDPDPTNGGARLLGPAAQRNIYVVPAHGDGPEVAVVKGGGNRSPVWTPDGKHILLLSDAGSGRNSGGILGMLSGGEALWSVSIENGKASAEPVLVKPTVGPEGLLNVRPVVAHRVTPSGAYYYEQQSAEERSEIREFGDPSRLENHSPKLIAGMIQAFWSPDGKRVAFYRNTRVNADSSPGRGAAPSNTSRAIIIYDVNTGEEKSYTVGNNGGGLRWFHDGKALLLVMNEIGQAARLYRLELQTGKFTQISDTNYMPVALSSDDRTGYFLSQSGSPVLRGQPGDPRQHIIAMDLKSGEQRELATVPATRGFSVILSPDNATLYMSLCQPATPTECRSIVAIDVNSGRQSSLFEAGDSENVAGAVALSGDGRWLAAIVSGTDHEQRLVRIGVEGNATKVLHEFKKDEYYFVHDVSGDGKYIFVRKSASGEPFSDLEYEPQLPLARIPVNGGEPQIVSIGIGAISPDGGKIAVHFYPAPYRDVIKIDNITAFLKTAK